ncbi:MAG: IS110 family transposase [Alphaproteobacteria bacterium]|nr:IS110 family transposase [Alphaproteobacteria bacterium]
MNMRRQSATAAGGLSDAFNDLLGGVHAAIDEAIAKMELELERRIKADPKTAEFYDRADSLQGFARRSLVQIIPELAAAPQTLTPRQMVAFAGFDPRPKKSGSSRAGESWSISKMGSRRLRRMLYVCARVAVRWHPPSRAYYEAMLARNKPRMVALVAVARKLLVALWVMWTRGVDFDPSAFTGRWSPDSA